ncbi:MAG TPA: hypothetical protein GX703_05525 [Erysipelothrix sp.]|nr:hypothetical protein [Erysipelothrix sp.]
MKNTKWLIILTLLVSCTHNEVQVEPTLPIEKPTIIIEETPLYKLRHSSDLTINELLVYKQPFYAPDLEEYKNHLNTYQDYQFIVDNISIDSDEQHNDFLTFEQALQDIDQIVTILKHAFGGLLDSAPIETLNYNHNLMKGLVPPFGLTTNELRDILIIGTSFIRDKHYWLDDTIPIYEAYSIATSPKYKGFLNPDEYKVRLPIYAKNLKLIKDSHNDYIDSSNNKKVVSNHDMIQPLIDNDGSFYYTIIDPNPYYPYTEPELIYYEDNSTKELIYESIQLHLPPSETSEHSTLHDDVLYIDLTKDAFQLENLEDIETVLERAQKSSKIIIDLRNNVGGQTTTGLKILSQILNSPLNNWNAFYRSYDKVYITNPLEIEISNEEHEQLFKNHLIVSYPQQELPLVEDKFILVLSNLNTASAGEYFLGDIKRLDNVINIGTNTAGAATSSVGQPYVLDHSKITLRVPDHFSAYHKETYSVKTGYLPDIWLNNVSLEQIIELMKGLK